MSRHIQIAIDERVEAMRKHDASISDLEAALAEAKVARAITEAELSAYRDALHHSSPKGRSKRSTVAGSRNRPISESWKYVLLEMAERFPASVSLDELEGIAANLKLSLRRDSIRAQMSLYKGKGYIDNPAPGSYTITAEGAAQVDVKLDEANEDTTEKTSPSNTLSKALGGTSLSGFGSLHTNFGGDEDAVLLNNGGKKYG